jgi:hypothetical protein
MALTEEDRRELFEHLAYLRESMENGISNDLAEISQSMDRIQAMRDQIVLMLASTITDLERANAKSQ